MNALMSVVVVVPRVLTKAGRVILRTALSLGLVLGVMSADGQTPADERGKSFDERSLAWRTALHFDPSAAAPLESLVELHAKAGRVPELVALYVNHLGTYPDDASATLVLGRVYLVTEDARTEAFLEKAIERFPENAELAWLRADSLEKKHRPGAMEARVRAVLATQDVARRDAWVGELISSAAVNGGAGILVSGLEQLVGRDDVTPGERVRWAGQALQAGQPEIAEVIVRDLDAVTFSGEAWIEASLVLCRVALAQGDATRAAREADSVLERLAPDHWRREEVLRLRWQCAQTEDDRAALVEASEKQWQANRSNEAEVLRHAGMLKIAGRWQDAVKHLEEALAQLPNSREIEALLLTLYEDERMDEQGLAFLKARLEAFPDRTDLAERRARWLLGLGRTQEGLETLALVTQTLSPGERLEEIVGTARWLRRRNLLAESAAVLEAGLKENPGLWSLRKELGELLAALRHTDELAALFAVPVPEETPLEVRMETAMFLVGQGLWHPARFCLESWVESHPAEFEGRLLLARICVLMGDTTSGETLLFEARDRADTAERYAAWLAAARSFAEEAGNEAGFLAAERSRLEPANGQWDARLLERLVQLGGFATEENHFEEAEALLRQALEAPAATEEGKRDLQVELVRLLDSQPARAKDQEALIRKLLEDPGDDAHDLRLRLVLLYERAGRGDLMLAELAQVDFRQCGDASVLGQVAAMLQRQGRRMEFTAAAERLVRLQPDQAEHWTRLISALAEAGDESSLRARLRDLRAVLVQKKLPPAMDARIRDHCVSSCWRSIARLLAVSDRKPAAGLVAPVLAELETYELTPNQKAWTEWMGAWLRGDTSLERAGPPDWLTFPDGLALSTDAAEALLQGSVGRPDIVEPVGAGMTGPVELAWGVKSRPGRTFLRWELMPDGETLIVMDSASELQALDFQTGRLLWERSLSPWVGVISTVGNERQEVTIEPFEWAAGDGVLVVLTPKGLVALDTRSGEPKWEAPWRGEQDAMTGSVAASNGRVFWWRVSEGALDGFEMENGRLAWTVEIPELARAPVTPSNQPVWVSTGVDAADDRVLVWGNGNAMCSTDGQMLWKAAARDSEVAFPLRVTDEEEDAEKRIRAAMAWTTFSPDDVRGGRESWPQGVALSTPLGMAAPAFSGVYGQATSSPWLTWGSEGVRKLREDRVWMVDRSGVSSCWAMGLPLTVMTDRSRAGRGGFVGFAGGGLVLSGGTSVDRVLPDGSVETLWSAGSSSSRPADHPMPAVGMDGRNLYLAFRDGLRVQDAVTGVVLWQGDWPDEVGQWRPDWKDEIAAYQSVRWSSRGVWLYDGQGTSRAIDWRAVVGKGRWLAPLGPETLACLRMRGDRRADD